MGEASAFPSERKQVSSEREKNIDSSVGMEGSRRGRESLGRVPRRCWQRALRKRARGALINTVCKQDGEKGR